MISLKGLKLLFYSVPILQRYDNPIAHAIIYIIEITPKNIGTKITQKLEAT